MSNQKTIHEKWEEGGISLLPDNPIVKLVYKREFFDITEMKIGARTITTITDDGSIVIKDYKPGSRKAYSTKKATCTKVAFEAVCDRLENCIETAKKWNMWVDDCSEELKIYYKFGRIQIVDRGLGNDDIDVATIMDEFLSSIAR